MNDQLIEAEEGYTFYCNNCKAKFPYVHSFHPTLESSSYYNCPNCNSILPTKDLKKIVLMNCILYYCCCFYLYK
jgi:DNA-directed RNA polymerase subunit RPC12/RpoP